MWLLEFEAVHQIPHQLSPAVMHSHEMLCFVIHHHYISVSLLILLILYTLTCRSRSSLRYGTAYQSILACDPYCCSGYGELSGGNCKNVNILGGTAHLWVIMYSWIVPCTYVYVNWISGRKCSTPKVNQLLPIACHHLSKPTPGKRQQFSVCPPFADKLFTVMNRTQDDNIQ